MSYSKKLLGEYADKLCRASTYEESFLAYEHYVNSLGFESALYSFIPRIALDNKLPQTPVFSISKNYNENYLKHYMEARFDQSDHIIHSIENGRTTAIDWWDEVKNGELNKKEKEVFISAKEDYQMRNGLSIPTLTGAKGIAATSIISNEKQAQFKKLKHENLEALWTSSRLFHNHIMCGTYNYKIFISPLLPSLSKTEKVVLKYVLEGLTILEISKAACKSYKYTENVLRSIRIKMAGLDENGKPKISKDLLIHYCGLLGIYDEL